MIVGDFARQTTIHFSSFEAACIARAAADQHRRGCTSEQSTHSGEMFPSSFVFAIYNARGPAQGGQERRTIGFLSLGQGPEFRQFLFSPVRFALPQVTDGLGDQETKRSPADLRVKGIEFLRLLEKSDGLIQCPPILRRLHQVQQGLAIIRQRSAPALSHSFGGFPIGFLPGPVQPLLKRFPMGVNGAGALEEFFGKQIIIIRRSVFRSHRADRRWLFLVSILIARKIFYEVRAYLAEFFAGNIEQEFCHVQVKCCRFRAILSEPTLRQGVLAKLLPHTTRLNRQQIRGTLERARKESPEIGVLDRGAAHRGLHPVGMQPRSSRLYRDVLLQSLN